jgi:hypothetical protein
MEFLRGTVEERKLLLHAGAHAEAVMTNKVGTNAAALHFVHMIFLCLSFVKTFEGRPHYSMLMQAYSYGNVGA